MPPEDRGPLSDRLELRRARVAFTLRHAALAVAAFAAAGSALPASAEAPDYRLFFEAASTDEKVSKDALDRIAGAGWQDGYAGLSRSRMR